MATIKLTGNPMKCNKRFSETWIFLLKGCGFKKGCKTQICRCRKKNTFCGPGCLCQSCTNLRTDVNNHNDSTSESNNSSSGSDTDLDINSDDDITDILQTEVVVTDNFEITKLIYYFGMSRFSKITELMD